MPDNPDIDIAQTPKARGPIAWMAGHSVTANLLMLVLLVGGFIMGTRIKKEVFPDFELDLVTISVPYPGASPAEVERGILLAIEDAIQDIQGIKEVTATAREGSGIVNAEIIEGENVQQVARDIQNEVDRITSWPEEAEDPTVVVAQRKRYVTSLALFGDQPERVLREMGETVRDRLLSDPDISQVELTGVREPEISIEISQKTLRTYGLTLDDVARRIGQASVEMPGGAIKTSSGDILMRVKERRDFGREFAKIPIITTADGTQVLLEQVATIRDDLEESDQFATFNGQPAVLIEVYRVGDQTPISVSEAVNRRTADINQSLPAGLKLESRNDLSDIYRQRLDLMVRNGYLGLGLVFVLLAIFLEIRLAFWVSLGIPISFIGGLLLMPLGGVSINMITMFAFIVTLGIVVDDAIIVGENIYHHRQSGAGWFEAAVSGAQEIAMPVTFSVMTNMITFMPLFFIPGFMGKIFKYIPIVVISVFFISLIECLFILPAHLGHQKGQPGGPLGWLIQRQQRFSDRFRAFIHNRYRPLLELTLRGRYVTLAVGVMILIVTVAYVRSGRMGFELFPKIESDYAMATLRLPFGSAVANTIQAQQQLIRAAKAVTDQNGGEEMVEGIFAETDANTASIRVYLTPPDVRPITTARFTELWRQEVGQIPGVETIKFESDAGGPGRGAAISVELSHRDTGILSRASEELAAALGFFPNVTDIDDGFAEGKRQLDFQVRPAAQRLGLSAADIARQVRHAYYGAEAVRIQRGRNEVKVMVRLPQNERQSAFFLEQKILRTPAGGEIPLGNAVTINTGRADTAIERRNGRRIVTVTADVRPRSQAGQVINAITADTLPALVQKYPGLDYSFSGRQAERRDSVMSLIRGLLGALLVIYVMLAIPFNSYLQPLIIMMAIPFGLTGAVIGHLIMGYSLSVMSMFGIVALSGVVVNDALVLIDFANRRRAGGMVPFDAITDAAVQRFRPILLTTLTTFGGLTPMIFETSRQARFLIPMALSLGYGILFATLINLVLVPSLYILVTDFQRVTGLSRPQVLKVEAQK